MNIGAIVQARISSTRLPGKVLLPLEGKPVLWHVLKRLQYAKKVGTVVLATSDAPEDRKLKEIADALEVPAYFGSLEDVLSRYYYAAKQYNIDTIVRITADCPMIDPGVVDEVIRGFLDGGYDYYGLSGSFPDGLDTAVFSFALLEIMFNEAILPSDREHVGATFIRKNRGRFKIGGYEKFSGKGHYRWTIDEPADYEFLKKVFHDLYSPEKPFLYKDVLELLKKKPELQKINSKIIRNEGYLKSLKKDKEFDEKGKK